MPCAVFAVQEYPGEVDAIKVAIGWQGHPSERYEGGHEVDGAGKGVAHGRPHGVCPARKADDAMTAFPPGRKQADERGGTLVGVW